MIPFCEKYNYFYYITKKVALQAVREKISRKKRNIRKNRENIP